jgi:hypothetical protein
MVEALEKVQLPTAAVVPVDLVDRMGQRFLLRPTKEVRLRPHLGLPGQAHLAVVAEKVDSVSEA